MVQYDPEFIQEFATGLYKQAKSIIPAHFFIGIFLGLILFGSISQSLVGTLDFLIMAIGVMAGGVVGFGSGCYKSLELKLRAQEVLCQARIEANTRM